MRPATFLPLPEAGPFRLAGARAPVSLLAGRGPAGDADGLARVDIDVADGRIARVSPAGAAPLPEGFAQVATGGAIVLPRLVDIHTHLDKGFIFGRAKNPDGGFAGALDAASRDRDAHWSADDVALRMDFGLRCALAHGTGAIRTHLDSIGRQTAISWPVFAELRETWRGIMTLQATSLFVLDDILDDEDGFRAVVETMARYEGALGGVTFIGRAPDARTDAALDMLFKAAIAYGLDIDLHVDESDSPHARTLERVADAAIRHRFPNRLLCGHCCSAALMGEADLDRLVDKLGRARIAIVSLPMCNMYLQDRASGRTPRWRGIAPIQEFKAAGL
ncbi:MAG: cytosine deaminase, partial [Salinarimonadaceae bacterium]